MGALRREFSDKVPRLTHAEWLEAATQLYGADPLQWKFKCPICGNVQSLEQFKQVSAKPDSTYQECIGRYLPRSERRSAFGEHGAKKIEKPCDYAVYGLFSLPGLIVTDEHGDVPIFAFADPLPERSAA